VIAALRQQLRVGSTSLGTVRAAESFALLFPRQFFHFPTRQLRRRRIDKRRLALQVQPINPFAGRIQDVLVTALELFQFLPARLHMELQYILGPFQLLALVRQVFLGLLALVEFLFERRVVARHLREPVLDLLDPAFHLLRARANSCSAASRAAACISSSSFVARVLSLCSSHSFGAAGDG